MDLLSQLDKKSNALCCSKVQLIFGKTDAFKSHFYFHFSHRIALKWLKEIIDTPACTTHVTFIFLNFSIAAAVFVGYQQIVC